MAQQSRLRVLRSPAFSLVSRSGAEEPRLADQLFDGLCPGELDALKAEVATYDAILAPADAKAESAFLLAEMGRAMALLGGGWSVAQRQEWQCMAAEVLSDLPFWLVLTAFPRVFHKVSFASEVVKWICADIDDEVARWRGESATLKRTIRLIEIGAARAEQLKQLENA